MTHCADYLSESVLQFLCKKMDGEGMNQEQEGEGVQEGEEEEVEVLGGARKGGGKV